MDDLDKTMREFNSKKENAMKSEPVKKVQATEKEGGVMGKGIAMAGVGAVAGVGVAAAMNMADEQPEEVVDETLATEEVSEDDLSNVRMAQSVNDSMSFDEAFAAARSEVGPNGVFEWNGETYNTYYEEEWNELSDDYKERFTAHNWNAESGEDVVVEASGEDLADADAEVADTEEVVDVQDDDAFFDAVAMDNLSVNDVQYASTPDDTMTFDEAFAAARSEVGINGVFEWRGDMYNTFYAEEWDALPEDYKEEFIAQVLPPEIEEVELEDVDVLLADDIDTEVVVDEEVTDDLLYEVLPDDDVAVVDSLRGSVPEDVPTFEADPQVAHTSMGLDSVSGEASSGLYSPTGYQEGSASVVEPLDSVYVDLDDDNAVVSETDEYIEIEDDVVLLETVELDDSIVIDDIEYDLGDVSGDELLADSADIDNYIDDTLEFDTMDDDCDMLV